MLVLAIFSVLFAALRGIIPSSGNINMNVVNGSIFAGVGAGLPATCLITKVLDQNNGVFCVREEIISSMCLGICTPTNYINNPRSCFWIIKI